MGKGMSINGWLGGVVILQRSFTKGAAMSQTYIDFQELKAAFSFDDAIDFLKLRVGSRENNSSAENAPQPAIPAARVVWHHAQAEAIYCFGAKKGRRSELAVGSAAVMGIGMRDAAMLIQEELVPAVPARTAVQDSSPRRQRQEPRLEPDGQRVTSVLRRSTTWSTTTRP